MSTRNQPPKIVTAPVARNAPTTGGHKLVSFAPVQFAFVEYEEAETGVTRRALALVLPGGKAYAIPKEVVGGSHEWADGAKEFEEGLSAQIVDRMARAQAKLAGAPPPPAPPPPTHDAVDVLGAVG